MSSTLIDWIRMRRSGRAIALGVCLGGYVLVESSIIRVSVSIGDSTKP
ncbi:MAG: hypothetical protein ACRDLF_01670 [Solirubrobacteraceae bacterium]